MAAPFELVEQPGGWVASNGASTLALRCGDEAGRVFRRRAIAAVGSDQARQVEWVVAELGGVRIYFDGAHVVVTREDLQP